MSLYLVLKFVHILAAIVAVGFNASYGVWLARAGQYPAAAPILLRGVKLLDDRFANPAYAFLLLTGIAMGPFCPAAHEHLLDCRRLRLVGDRDGLGIRALHASSKAPDSGAR